MNGLMDRIARLHESKVRCPYDLLHARTEAGVTGKAGRFLPAGHRIAPGLCNAMDHRISPQIINLTAPGCQAFCRILCPGRPAAMFRIPQPVLSSILRQINVAERDSLIYRLRCIRIGQPVQRFCLRPDTGRAGQRQRTGLRAPFSRVKSQLQIQQGQVKIMIRVKMGDQNGVNFQNVQVQPLHLFDQAVGTVHQNVSVDQKGRTDFRRPDRSRSKLYDLHVCCLLPGLLLVLTHLYRNGCRRLFWMFPGPG